MKKLLVWVLVVAMAFTIAGCNSNQETPETPQQTPQNGTTTAPTAPTTDFPKGDVKIVVARSAGGSNDTACRTFQPYMQNYLGSNVIVENVAGSGGAIGNTQVWTSPADGYNLLYTTLPTDVLYEVVTGGVDYSMAKFEPVYNVMGNDSNIIITSADSGLDTLDKLVEKGTKEGISVGMMTGVSITYMGLALLLQETDLELDDITFIPYEGNSEILPAIMGGHIDFGIVLPSGVLDAYKTGRINVLTSFTKERTPTFPDLPTFCETYPGDGANYYYVYQGIMAPNGTPSDVIDVLASACDQAIKDPDFIAAAKSSGLSLQPMGPKDFSQAITDFYSIASNMKPVLLEMRDSLNNAKK